ncbi:MAG TPA: hypothetical protein VN631_16140, partial [Negativicutes bacterium]|nr:hypothetical protein [Negativicutes bacterium]
LCALLLLLTTGCSLAFAAAAAPYASIVAYNERLINGEKPNISTLGVLDIINMTPWNISIGPSLDTPMLNGMTNSAWHGMWLAGINYNNQPWMPSPNGPPSTNGLGGSYAFHSFQVGLSNLNNAWVLNKTATGYSYPVYYDTIPIVFNSKTFTQGNQTVALNFSPTSTEGLGVIYYQLIGTQNVEMVYPANALSIGDGTNNYGWNSSDTTISTLKSTTHFLTIQGTGTTANDWKPITNGLGGMTAYKGADGSAKGAPVQAPTLLTVAGLVYPNFSNVAGDTRSLDLVVILQAGGYGDMQLLFLAVPNGRDTFLPGVSAVRK